MSTQIEAPVLDSKYLHRVRFSSERGPHTNHERSWISRVNSVQFVTCSFGCLAPGRERASARDMRFCPSSTVLCGYLVPSGSLRAAGGPLH